jgi:hypothetical protein
MSTREFETHMNRNAGKAHSKSTPQKLSKLAHQQPEAPKKAQKQEI